MDERACRFDFRTHPILKRPPTNIEVDILAVILLESATTFLIGPVVEVAPTGWGMSFGATVATHKLLSRDSMSTPFLEVVCADISLFRHRWRNGLRVLFHLLLFNFSFLSLLGFLRVRDSIVFGCKGQVVFPMAF